MFLGIPLQKKLFIENFSMEIGCLEEGWDGIGLE